MTKVLQMPPAILLICIKRPPVFKTFVLSIIEWPLKTGFQKPVLSDHSQKKTIEFQDRILLNAGRKYCRMLQEHSAILLTFIKLPFVFKTFLSIFECRVKTCFTINSVVI